MGILNRTPDSFFDAGQYWQFQEFLRKAEELVAQAPDILDIGGVKAAPGSEVTEAEEMDRVIPAVQAVASRFDIPISVDTWRASVAEEAYKQGAVMGNDISGFADPEYLQVAAQHNVSVVACHVRLAPRLADPNPQYSDLLEDVLSYLNERVAWGVAAGLSKNQIFVDAGLDLGKTPAMSADLLRHTDYLKRTGCPILLSASNKGFLGYLCDMDITSRDIPSTAAHALGVLLGCRVLRVHNVRATRLMLETLALDTLKLDTPGLDI